MSRSIEVAQPSVGLAGFEQRFAGAVGARYAVAVSSSTAALRLALQAAGVGPGDDVVVPSFAFAATADAVRLVGGRPVFADVEMLDSNLSVETVAAAMTPYATAVVVVHQAGVPADLARLREWCAARQLALIENAASAVGSTYLGRPVGEGAQVATWSFDPLSLVATGGGGVVTTDDLLWADRIRAGVDHPMTALQVALGLVQLDRLPGFVARRREMAERYRRALRTVPGIRPVADPEWGEANAQSLWVELTAAYPLPRDELLREFADAGIAAQRGGLPTHQQPAFRGHPHGPLTHTRWLAANTVILPLSHELTVDEQDRIVETVRRPSVVGRR